MKNATRQQYVTRNDIMKQLSDVEVTHVSTAETATQLAEGDEYLDLAQLERGVQKACQASQPTMGHVLPKKAIPASTWKKLIALGTPKERCCCSVATGAVCP